MAAASTDLGTTWVDITDISQWQGPPTGIQRVVHELGRRVLQSGGATSCCRFDPELGVFVAAPDTALNDPFHTEEAVLTHTTAEVGRPTTQRRARFELLARTRAHRRSASPGPNTAKREVAKDVFATGDRLVIIGANWLTPGYAQHLHQVAIDSSIEITQVMYDLVPSMYPQWAATGAASIVTPFLVRVLPLCKNIICISHNTLRDVQQFVATNDITLHPDVNLRVVELGANSPTKASSPPTAVNPDAPFILCVGTLEVRKNQIVLYQAYREAVERGVSLPKLYCVGRIGWLAEATEHAIRHDPAINSSIEILDSVRDAQLQWLYEHCLLTVYPSLYEGWGLPVGESLAHAKICITTRQASLPEVGGELADYASPFCSTDWLDAIVKYLDPAIRSQREAAIRTGFRNRTWDDAGNEFCAALGLDPGPIRARLL